MSWKDFAMVGLTFALLISLGVNPQPTHQCDSREIQAHCFDFSASGITCYTQPAKIGGKRCSEGWSEIIYNKNEQSKDTYNRVICTSEGCTRS